MEDLMAVNLVDLEFSAADLSHGVTSDVFGGLWWRVAEWAESLGRACQRVTWTILVVSAAMDTSALDLLIVVDSKVIGWI